MTDSHAQNVAAVYNELKGVAQSVHGRAIVALLDAKDAEIARLTAPISPQSPALLRESLRVFGPSADGAVERDLAAAENAEIARLQAELRASEERQANLSEEIIALRRDVDTARIGGWNAAIEECDGAAHDATVAATRELKDPLVKAIRQAIAALYKQNQSGDQT